MAVTEAWALDGVALMGGNFDILELVADPPKARLDWVSAADSEFGALMRQPLHENRTVTLKLRVTQQASMNAALDQVGAIRDKLRLASATADGIALTWTPANSTRTVTFDVLAGDIPELPIGLDGQSWSWFKQRPVFTIELTCKPYWRGAEVTTSTASSSTPFVTLEVASVPGDIPALGRLIVTDTATQNRRHVEWGLESQNYNSGTSLLVDSDNMTVGAGFTGAQTTRTGAYDPNATGNNVIRSNLYWPTAAVCSTGILSHVGSFRVKARVFAGTTGVRVRISRQDGDGPFIANPFAVPAAAGVFAELDLGVVTIPPKASGTQRWVGKIEAYSDLNGDTVDIDYLILVPAEEGYGKSRAAYTYRPGQIVAADNFDTLAAAAALNARVAPLGGTWATSGTATDFVGRTSTGGAAARATTADTGNGRLGVLGATNYSDVEETVWFQSVISSGQITSGTINQGLIARYVDGSNYLFGYVVWTSAPKLRVQKVIAGVTTTVAEMNINGLSPNWWQLRLLINASGTGILQLELPSAVNAALVGDVRFSLAFSDTTLATAGTLQTGKPGIIDFANGTPSITGRVYDNFIVYVPVAEPIVVYSGRTIEVRHNDTLRTDSTGTYYGRPPTYRGSRFLVPPGTSRVLAKARRNDIEVAADDQVTDATQIQVAYTPRGLVVPR